MDLEDRLRFRRIDISNDNRTRLKDALSQNKTLSIADFSECELTDDVVGALCGFIIQNKTHVQICFRKSKFTEAGLSRMLDALARNQTLSYICFDNSDLTDEVLGPLCRFIHQNRTIKNLLILSSDFMVEDLCEMMSTLRDNNSLSSVNFDDGLSRDVLVPVLAYIKRTENLQSISCISKGQEHYVEILKSERSNPAFYAMKKTLVLGKPRLQKLSSKELLKWNLKESPTSASGGNLDTLPFTSESDEMLQTEMDSLSISASSDTQSIGAASSLDGLSIADSGYDSASMSSKDSSSTSGSRETSDQRVYRGHRRHIGTIHEDINENTSGVIHRWGSYSISKNMMISSQGDTLADHSPNGEQSPQVQNIISGTGNVGTINYIGGPKENKSVEEASHRISSGTHQDAQVETPGGNGNAGYSGPSDPVIPSAPPAADMNINKSEEAAKVTLPGPAQGNYPMPEIDPGRVQEDSSESQLPEAESVLPENEMKMISEWVPDESCDPKDDNSEADGSDSDSLNWNEEPDYPGYCTQYTLKGKEKAVIKFKKGIFSDDAIGKIKTAIQQHCILKEVMVDERFTEDCVEPLVSFIQAKPELVKLQPYQDGNVNGIRIEERGLGEPSYYLFERGAEQTTLKLPSIQLQGHLKEWLTEESISSAVDATDNKLVIFVQKEKEKETTSQLKEKVKQFGDIFSEQYKVEHVKQIIVTPKSGSGKIKSGCQIVYTDDEKHSTHIVTCGAFVKDEKGKVYALSSCHTHNPGECNLTDSKGNLHPCSSGPYGYQTDPLVDVVLFDFKEKAKAIDPVMYKPRPNSVLFGPYTGPIENLSEIAGNVRKPADVMKLGSKSNLTEGTLSYFSVNHPPNSITGALVISPVKPKKAFAQQGDSGSVIFMKDKQEKKEARRSEYTFHEAVAVLCQGVNGLPIKKECSLAFRLDHAIEHLQKKYGKRFTLVSGEVKTTK